MTHRALFLGEGTSDLPLAVHIASLASNQGVDLDISHPDLSLLPNPPKHDVASQVRAALSLTGHVSAIFVHRDADRVEPKTRRQQVLEAVASVDGDVCRVAVIPVRMTEAWLILDEAAIRRVAGNPSDRTPLGLPAPSRAESLADPKERLREALLAASGLNGRRRRDFAQDFGYHRRQLLERLDLAGPVARLASFRGFAEDVRRAVHRLAGSSGSTLA